MESKVYRYNPTPHYTLGIGLFGAVKTHILERPWIDEGPGGKPNESCVPYGKYDLEPFTRPDNTEVYMLVNESLGVYRFQEDVPPEGGRFLILIHVGNYIDDIIGCLAPGLAQPTHKLDGAIVGSSTAACRDIFAELDKHEHNTLEILPLEL